MESKSTNSFQSKSKLERSYQSQSKLSFTNFLIILNNVSTQEPLMAPISIMTVPDSKVKESAPWPILIKVSNKYEDKDINISKAGLLIKQNPIEVENISIENSPFKTLLSKNISKVDQQERVNGGIPNILLVNQTNTPYNLRQRATKKD